MKRGLLGLIPGAGLLLAMSPRNEPVPVDRLLANTAAAIREDPNNAAGYSLMGRLHALAFAKVAAVPAVIASPTSFPIFDRDASSRPARNATLSLQKADIDHARASLKNYRRAIVLDPENPLYHYSLAWMDHCPTGRGHRLRNIQPQSSNPIVNPYRSIK